MASMMISTYLSFLPQRTVLFCVIVLCVGFFGIFIPFQERKKKKQQARKRPSGPSGKPKPAAKEKDNGKLEQLEVLKNAGILSEDEYRNKKREIR